MLFWGLSDFLFLSFPTALSDFFRRVRVDASSGVVTSVCTDRFARTAHLPHVQAPQAEPAQEEYRNLSCSNPLPCENQRSPHRTACSQARKQYVLRCAAEHGQGGCQRQVLHERLFPQEFQHHKNEQRCRFRCGHRKCERSAPLRSCRA